MHPEDSCVAVDIAQLVVYLQLTLLFLDHSLHLGLASIDRALTSESVVTRIGLVEEVVPVFRLW